MPTEAVLLLHWLQSLTVLHISSVSFPGGASTLAHLLMLITMPWKLGRLCQKQTYLCLMVLCQLAEGPHLTVSTLMAECLVRTGYPPAKGRKCVDHFLYRPHPKKPPGYNEDTTLIVLSTPSHSHLQTLHPDCFHSLIPTDFGNGVYSMSSERQTCSVWMWDISTDSYV